MESSKGLDLYSEVINLCSLSPCPHALLEPTLVNDFNVNIVMSEKKEREKNEITLNITLFKVSKEHWFKFLAHRMKLLM